MSTSTSQTDHRPGTAGEEAQPKRTGDDALWPAPQDPADEADTLAPTPASDGEREDSSSEVGTDEEGTGDTDHGKDRHGPVWRGLRRVEGLVEPVNLLAALAMKALMPPRLVRALRAGKPLVVVVTVPSVTWVKPVEAVIETVSGYKARCLTRISRPRLSADTDPDAQAADVIAKGRPVVAISPDQVWLAPVLGAAADHLIDVPPLDVALVTKAVTLWCGRRPRVALDPADLAGLDILDYAAALRSADTRPADIVARIRRASRARVGLPEDERVAPLDQLTGYGEARTWALQMVEVVAGVRRGEVDRSLIEGAVFHGPAGTGKTTLAKSLAQASGSVFVQGSIGQWFAESPGYLDSIVKKMSEFGRALEIAAKSNGSAVGFIDELDALPSRDRVDDRHASFWTPVITYFLILTEKLRRSGVLLLGATNNLLRVDPALLRPGRFDRQFLIGPPDEAGRAGILRGHLGADLADADLGMVARLSPGMTGAVLAGAVRAARRGAQAAGRAMTRDDLMAEIAPADPRPVAHLRAIALHEAAHAVVALRLGFPLVQVSIQAGDRHEGRTVVSITDRLPDRLALEREVIGLLAGRAADGVIGAGVSAGAATDLQSATQRLAALHVSYGLGERLSAPVDADRATLLLREDAGLAGQVEADLHRLQRVAEDLVRADRMAIQAVVEALLAQRVLAGAEVAALVEPHRPRFRIAAGRRPAMEMST